MAEHQMNLLAEKARNDFCLTSLILRHRVGFVPVGEASLFLRVAAGHRAAAFSGSQWLIEELKQKVPIWKRPVFKDKESADRQKDVQGSGNGMNWANRLTLSRLLLTILFVIALNSSWAYGRTAALVLFLVAGATDFFDGEVARRYAIVTNFGKLMDPLVDKVMMAAAFICLVPFKAIPAWAATVVVARDFLITGLRLMASAQGQVLPAERLGKHKTSWQIVTILFFSRCLRRAN